MTLGRRVLGAISALILAQAALLTDATPAHAADPVTNEEYHLLNRGSGLRLGIEAASTENLADAVQFAENTSPDQVWTLGAIGTLQNLNSDKYLSVEAGGTQNLNHVVQYKWVGTPDQFWDLKPSPWGRNLRTIVNRKSGKCLGIEAGSTQNLAQAVIYTCDGTPNQSWYFVEWLG